MMEHGLWSTVLRLAIEDYKAGQLPWSYFVSRDFLFVCAMGGLDPSVIRRGVRPYIAGVKAKDKRRTIKKAKALAKRRELARA